ncbi:hypothetical protein ACVWW4_002152 [Bradyrhizobium sp. LB7.1]
MLPILSATRRDTRTCSRPCASSSAISAIAGERRRRRMAFRRSSSFVDSSGGRRESHLIWLFDLADELADLNGRGRCLLALGRRQKLLLLAI